MFPARAADNQADAQKRPAAVFRQTLAQLRETRRGCAPRFLSARTNSNPRVVRQRSVCTRRA
eukprot:3902415-Pleurochrysis_carterae.AAC.1